MSVIEGALDRMRFYLFIGNAIPLESPLFSAPDTSLNTTGDRSNERRDEDERVTAI